MHPEISSPSTFTEFIFVSSGSRIFDNFKEDTGVNPVYASYYFIDLYHVSTESSILEGWQSQGP